MLFRFSTQGCTNVAAVAKGSANVTPYILLTEDDEHFQAFLVVDKTIVCPVDVLDDIPFVLMSAFLCLTFAFVILRAVIICFHSWKY